MTTCYIQRIEAWDNGIEAVTNLLAPCSAPGAFVGRDPDTDFLSNPEALFNTAVAIGMFAAGGISGAISGLGTLGGAADGISGAISGLGTLGATPEVIAVAEGGSVFDWISGAWDSVTSWLGGAPEASLPAELDLGGGFDPGGSFGGGSLWPEAVSSAVGEVWDYLPGLVNGGAPGAPAGAIIPAMGTLPRTGAAILGGAAMGTGLRTLGSLFGSATRGARFVINGISGSIPQLWKYTRKFGPQAVAAALGIGVAELSVMLLQNPERAARRRRGISARDIRTTKRVVGFVSKMAHTIGCVRAPRHFTRSRR